MGEISERITRQCAVAGEGAWVPGRHHVGATASGVTSIVSWAWSGLTRPPTEACRKRSQALRLSGSLKVGSSEC